MMPLMSHGAQQRTLSKVNAKLLYWLLMQAIAHSADSELDVAMQADGHNKQSRDEGEQRSASGGVRRKRAHLWRTLTMPSSRWLPQRVAGVMPGKLKLGSLLQPARDMTNGRHERQS